LYCGSAPIYVDLVETKKDHHFNNVSINVKEWREVITIEYKCMNIKLDTGAEVSIIPLTLFDKINKQFKVRPTNVTLQSFQGTYQCDASVIPRYHSKACEYSESPL
jgi:hypothetical protein